jgi:hypothetical protein
MRTDLVVYVLRFEGVGPLSRAFDRAMGAPEVESCSLELHQRQLRLLAPLAVAERLVERLYLEGGLAWCTRHAFEVEPDAPPSRTG